MTRASMKAVQQTAKVIDVKIEVVKSGVERYSMVLDGRVYSSKNSADRALTTKYIRQKGKK